MLTNFDPFPFFRYFLGRRLVRETSVIIVFFRRPVFKDVNSWICSVISFCKSVMATNKLDMMLVSLISSLFLLLCHIPPCPQIGSSAIDQILPPHSTGEVQDCIFCIHLVAAIVCSTGHYGTPSLRKQTTDRPLDIFSSKLFGFLLLEAYE